MKREKLLTKEKPIKSILILGLPLILSQLINVLYNIVDRIFIGNMTTIGSEALAGVGVTLPIIVIVSAFAALFGLGGSPKAAIKLGENDEKAANNIMMNSLIMLVITGVVLTVLMLVFNKPLLYLFGMQEELLHYGLDYLNIYAIGTVFVMLSLGLNFYVSASGNTKEAAIFVLVGAIINIILDPILIFGFSLGVKGAAIATIFSQGVSALLIIIFLANKKRVLHFSFKNFKLDGRIILSIVALGISPFIMQSTEALIQIVFNNQISRYTTGSDYIIYMNVMTIMMSILQFMILPVHGLTQGASPLLSYNYGSGNHKRVKESYKLLIILSFTYTLIFYLFILISPNLLVMIFNRDPETLLLTPKLMRIFFLGLSFMGIQSAVQVTFMALNQPIVSLTMAILRKIVILIPLAYILPVFMGVEGVFYSEMIADILAVTITFTTFALMINNILNKKANELNLLKLTKDQT